MALPGIGQAGSIGDDNDRNVFTRVFLAEHFEHVIAVYFGHENVQEDKIRFEREGLVITFHAVVGNGGLVADVGEFHFVKLAKQRFVFDD